MIDVSTHAPIKDATVAYPLLFYVITVSTHAPIKDATHLEDIRCIRFGFQPTHP